MILRVLAVAFVTVGADADVELDVDDVAVVPFTVQLDITRFHTGDGFAVDLDRRLLREGRNAQRKQQKLGRGVVAVQNGSNVTVTWRRLAQEPEDATWNIYIKKNLQN